MKKLLIYALVLMEVTAYCPTGNHTASGVYPVEGRTVACDHLPFGTRVRINGHVYIVEDRFGGGYTNKIDIFMESYEKAIRFGRQVLDVEVLD